MTIRKPSLAAGGPRAARQALVDALALWTGEPVDDRDRAHVGAFRAAVAGALAAAHAP
ncbi:hypothetical protein [Streptomyces sp. NPDC002588]|uniref:hypothetical protein n=1 Tax=Streptomyces sp. NPDC002588 TaxID=3154419 RepID=UPI00332B1741